MSHHSPSPALSMSVSHHSASPSLSALPFSLDLNKHDAMSGGAMDPLVVIDSELDSAPFYPVTEPSFYPAVNSGASSDSSSDDDVDSEEEEVDDDGGGIAGALKRIMNFGRSSDEAEHVKEEEDEDDEDDDDNEDDVSRSINQSDHNDADDESQDGDAEISKSIHKVDHANNHISDAESIHSNHQSINQSDQLSHRSHSRRSDLSISSSQESDVTDSTNHSSQASSNSSHHDHFPWERNLFALQPHYIFLKRLYACKDAVTYKAIQRSTGRVCVIKLSDDYTHGHDPKEVRLLTTVQGHENICQLMGWHPLTATDCSAMVTLFVPNEEVEDTVFLSRRKQQRYMSQMLAALIYMHQHNVLYRDVKPSNVLWNDATETVTVIDFDIATYYSHEHKHRACVGTDGYFAPEILRLAREKRMRRAERRGEELSEDEYAYSDDDDDEEDDDEQEEASDESANESAEESDKRDDKKPHDDEENETSHEVDGDDEEVDGYDFAVDVYSSGVVLSQLLFRVGEECVADLDDRDAKGPAFRRQARSRIADAKARGEPVENNAEVLPFDLAARMLEPNPHKRITLEECLHHPWFNVVYPSKEEDERKRIESEADAHEPFDTQSEQVFKGNLSDQSVESD